jgi:hypothetical protein
VNILEGQNDRLLRLYKGAHWGQGSSDGAAEATIHIERILERLGFAQISGVATVREPGQNWAEHAPRLLAAAWLCQSRAKLVAA